MQQFRRERPTTFLDLPAEIRVEIYDLSLVERQTVRIPERLLSNAVDFNIHPSCVFVSKYMRKPRLFSMAEMRCDLCSTDVMTSLTSGADRDFYRSPWLEPAISGLSED